jgi:murein DD-endopeptidase MepM/ murein hydrolase activator NlpD
MKIVLSPAFFIVGIQLFALSVFSQDYTLSKPEMTYYGTFKTGAPSRTPNQASSSSGRFCCIYGTETIQEELFDIKNLKFFDGATCKYTMKYVPGNSMDISNAGFMVCYQNFAFREDSLILHFFSKEGMPLFRRTYTHANLFGFSQTGNFFGVGTPEKFELISLPSGIVETFPSVIQFDISADEHTIVLGLEKQVLVYRDAKLISSISHAIPFFREVKISPDAMYVAFIGKNELFAYDVNSGNLKFSDKTEREVAFADLRLTNTVVWAGIHSRNNELTKSDGILKTYDLQGRTVSEEVQASWEAPPATKLNYNYKPGEFPWPIKPFDTPGKPWNSYLQLSTSSDGANSGAYCHQGLDLDVPSYVEIYSVADGFVKAVLTIGGDIYWRTAISEIQTADSAEAWLYAHLDQTSITVKVGDQVKKGVTLLGKVIPWSGLPGGHLHYSRLKDKGTTWSGNWRNFANPAFLLRPIGDTDPPQILVADGASKFAFSTNDGSGTPTYLKSDNLSGDIDIIVKVSDKCGLSTWNQAATSIYYWVNSSATGATVFPRTMAYIRGQTMPDYSGALYNSLAPVIWRVDSKYPAKGWFTHERIYAHVITNSHGDSAIATADKSRAFGTKKFNDGKYRIVVEVGDVAGNKTIDSQEVTFKNGTSGNVENSDPAISAFRITKVYSAGSATVGICFQLPKASMVTMKIIDMAGREIKSLIGNAPLGYGNHTLIWNGTNIGGQAVHAGTYFLLMSAGDFSQVEKLLLIK